MHAKEATVGRGKRSAVDVVPTLESSHSLLLGEVTPFGVSLGGATLGGATGATRRAIATTLSSIMD